MLFLCMMIRGAFSKTADLRNKMCILIIFLHSLMDIDMQFPVIWFALVLCLTEDTATKTIYIRKGTLSAFVAIGCLCVYFGAVSSLYYIGNMELCSKIYPYHTQANAVLLQQAATPVETEEYADRILKVNDASSLAWSAKARVAYANGNFERVIQYKEKAISLARYAKEEYLDYFEMLWVGYQLYTQHGDTSSAEVCRQKLLSIPEMVGEVLEATSKRAWKITDKPDLTLPDDFKQILQMLQR